MDVWGNDPGRGKKTERLRECNLWCLREGLADGCVGPPMSGAENDADIGEGNAWSVGEDMDPLGAKEGARGEETDGENEVDEIERFLECCP
jgi:hypothetical protein